MAKKSNELGRIIDFGAHFCPSSPPDDKDGHQFIKEQQGAALYADIEALRNRYAEAGVDGVTLSREDVIGSDDVEKVRRENDAMLEIAQKHDDIYTLAAIPTGAGSDQAAAELRRCLQSGHHGGVIRTESNGIELHHVEVESIFEVASQFEAPLMVHPKVHDSLHPEVLNDEWRLNAIFGREVAVCESIFKVVHSGVLDRFPDLDLVFHHLGGNIASMIGRIRGELDERDWPDTEQLKPYTEFRTQLERRVMLDTAGFYGDPAAFRATFNVFSPSNILFGSDFPYETRTAEDFRNIISTIQECCTESETRDVLGRNARSLLSNT